MKTSVDILRSSLLKYTAIIKNSRLAKDSVWAVLGSIVGKGLALVAGIFIARLLGKEIYGEYGIIKNTLTYLAIVSTFGFGYTATKYVAEYKERNSPRTKWLVRNILLFTVFFSSLLTIVLFVFAEPIAIFIKAPELSIIFQKYGVVVVFNAIVSTQIGILSGFKNFKANAKVNCYSGILLFIFSVLFTYYGGLDGAILALLLSFIFHSILDDIIIRSSLKSFPKIEKGKNGDLISMISFSFPIALQEGLYTVVRWITAYLLIKYSNYGEVGLSSVAATWAAIVIFIPGMLKNVMFSYLTTAENHNHLVNRLLLFNFVSTVIPVVILIAFSRIICSFYGPSFTGLPIVFIISLVSAVFTSVSEVYCYDFISRGFPWTIFIARLLRDIMILIVGWLILSNVSNKHAMYLALAGLLGSIFFYIVLFIIYRKQANNTYE